MPRSLQLVFAFTLVALAAGGPVWYWLHRDRHFRHFRVVDEGVLYRSGQLDPRGLKRLVAEYGFKTIVCLREGDTADDQAEEKWARSEALNFVRIPPRAWQAGAGPAPAERGLEVFRRVMDDPANYPVLIHCFAGIHRTGAHVAVYRMDRGWSTKEAMNEMRAAGYSILDDHQDVIHFLTHYRPTPRSPGAEVEARPASRPTTPSP